MPVPVLEDVYSYRGNAKRTRKLRGKPFRLPYRTSSVQFSHLQPLQSIKDHNPNPNHRIFVEPTTPRPAVCFCTFFDPRTIYSRAILPQTLCPVGVAQRDRISGGKSSQHHVRIGQQTTSTTRKFGKRLRKCSPITSDPVATQNTYHDLPRAYDHEFTTMSTCAISATLV